MEIDASALQANLEEVRRRADPARLIPMVKADAYGLGVRATIRTLRGRGVWGFGVATVEEGCELRDLGVDEPVVVFTPVWAGEVERAVGAGLTLAVSGASTLKQLAAAARRTGDRPAFHLEVDTGMGRAGLPWDRAREWGPRLASILEGEPLRWTGLFTHFHSADRLRESEMRSQWDRFQEVREVLQEVMVPPDDLLIHACNSAALLRHPALAAGAVRPGIFLYGGQPGTGLPEPLPVVSVRARIGLVREVEAGATVGYGATYRAQGRERWATVEMGYGDGLPRALSNGGAVLVRGRRAPIAGRISMDMTVVDITRVPEVQAGEVVTFVGRDGDERISLEEFATWAGTINYEILTGFARRVPRIWLGGGEG